MTQIKQFMSTNVTYIDPKTTLKEAAEKMRTGDIGALPVGENDRLVGMVTDRDITVRGVAEGKDPAKTTVKDAMSEKIIYCQEDQDVTEVTQMMKDKQIRRVVVLNNDKRMVGICSLGDIATGGGKDEMVGETLEHVSRKSETPRNS